jgi:hypothetical protein
MCVYSHPTHPIFQPPTLTLNSEIVVPGSGISFSKFPVSRHLLKLFYDELRSFSTFFANITPHYFEN